MFEFILKKRLRSADPQVRVRAVTELARSNSQGSKAALVTALDDDHDTVRIEAVSGLARRLDEDIATKVVKLFGVGAIDLKKGYPEKVRLEVVSGLTPAVGGELASTLLKLALVESLPSVSAAAIQALNRSDQNWRSTPQAKQQLSSFAREAVGHPKRLEKLKIATDDWRTLLDSTALIETFLAATAKPHESFITLLNDLAPNWRGERRVREWVATQKARINELSDIEVNGLDVTEPTWRQWPELERAVRQLIARPELSAEIMEKLRALDPMWAARDDARDRVAALVEALAASTDESQKVSLIATLARGGVRDAIPVVTKIYKDNQHAWVTPLSDAAQDALKRIDPVALTAAQAQHAHVWVTRQGSLRSLANVDPELAGVVARDRLRNDDDWNVRETAASVLGRVAPQGAISDLAAALRDKSKQVRHAARRSLSALGTSEAAAVLASAPRREVRAIVFRPGPAVADAAGYATKVAERFFDDEPMLVTVYRVVGVKEPLDGGRAVSLYDLLVREGKLPNLGNFDYSNKQYWSGDVGDGVSVTALFF